MEQRVLGKTGISVSTIGFGAWAIGSGWGESDDSESKAALHRALDLGCNFIDTALAYGEGRSERLIREVFHERGSRVPVATKVPPMDREWGPPPGRPISDVFPPHYIVECCEKSLQSLGMDCVDVLQLHTWSEEWNDTDEWYETMVRLREQGKIRAIGISVHDGRPAQANRSIAMGRVDTIQVIYNILDQEARTTLFPVAREHGASIIARVPLASGALTGKFREDTVFPEGDWRSEVYRGEKLREVVKQVGEVRKALGDDGVPMVQRAIQFAVVEPVVATVIPGVRRPAQADQNFGAASTSPLTSEQTHRLYALAQA